MAPGAETGQGSRDRNPGPDGWPGLPDRVAGSNGPIKWPD